MQREIKFRAWDKQDKQWYQPTFRAYEGRLHQLFVSLSGSLSAHTMAGMEHESLWPDRYELMQYTGLKDKNGQEIYEGDVLRIDGWKEPQQVIWHKWGAWHLNGGAYELGFFNPHICMEIIGNIYENPDLLQ